MANLSIKELSAIFPFSETQLESARDILGDHKDSLGFVCIVAEYLGVWDLQRVASSILRKMESKSKMEWLCFTETTA